jgi:hypothetical protein
MSASAARSLEPVPVDVRVGLESDLRFVVASWVASMRGVYPNRYAHDYWTRMTEDVRAHIDRATTLVAYLDTMPDEIVSYLVSIRRGGIVIAHFAYTKDGARREGHVARLLALANPDGLPLSFTQPAKNENAMAHFCKRAIFAPHLWSET